MTVVQYREQVGTKGRRSEIGRGRWSWEVRSWKNTRWKKSKKSSEVLGMMESVYSEIWYLRKRGEFRKCKEGSI